MHNGGWLGDGGLTITACVPGISPLAGGPATASVYGVFPVRVTNTHQVWMYLAHAGPHPPSWPSLEYHEYLGQAIQVANRRQTPMHRLQDAAPERLKCHDLNGWRRLPYSTRYCLEA